MAGRVHVDLHDNSNGGRVATVCYDRADKLNVVGKEDAAALAAAIARAGASAGVRVPVPLAVLLVLLSGTGALGWLRAQLPF